MGGMHWSFTGSNLLNTPEGPSTQYLATLVTKIRVWFLEPDSFNLGYLDPLVYCRSVGVPLKSVLAK